MEVMMRIWAKTGLAPVLIMTIAVLFGSTSSQVTHHPSPSDNLIARWEWAMREAGMQKSKNGFWIGYSIKRLMGAHQSIYSTYEHTISSTRFIDFAGGDPLEKILSKKITYGPLTNDEQVKHEAKRALSHLERTGESEQKVWKDVAILYKFGSGPSKIPISIRVCNLYIPFDPERLSIFWLDQTDDAQSISILEDLYESSNQEKLKKRIISVAGLHRTGDHVVSFLEKVLKSSDPDTLRARAASELGDQDHDRAVKLLHQAAKEDRSFEVRKKSVYGLEDINLPGAADALIDIAKNGKDSEIQKKAIDSLADIATQKTATALKNVVDNDEDTDIQKRAVYALEDLPGDEGIPYLIEIAKNHKKATLRKAAIYCLGDSKDPRALQALIEIIKRKQY